MLYTLSEVLEPQNFCYLNTIMMVQFPVSDKYCEETDWQRHRKTIEIFEEILNKVTQRPSRGCFFKLVELIVFFV